MNLYESIKNDLKEPKVELMESEIDINKILEDLLRENKITRRTKASDISDDKFDNLVGQLKTKIPNKSEKELTKVLAQYLLAHLNESELKPADTICPVCGSSRFEKTVGNKRILICKLCGFEEEPFNEADEQDLPTDYSVLVTTEVSPGNYKIETVATVQTEEEAQELVQKLINEKKDAHYIVNRDLYVTEAEGTATADLYQVTKNIHGNAYFDLDEVENFDFNNYSKVGTIEYNPTGNVDHDLEQLFRLGNTEQSVRDANPQMHSISVSDILKLGDSYYYVNGIGFKDVTELITGEPAGQVIVKVKDKSGREGYLSGDEDSLKFWLTDNMDSANVFENTRQDIRAAEYRAKMNDLEVVSVIPR